MDLKGKVALITGSGRGIGKAIARKLAQQGADVVINDVDLEVASKTAKEMESYGVKALAVKAFVNQPEEVKAMFETIIKEFGTLDILVNNAGITKDGLLTKLTDEQFDQVIDVNLKGTFLCAREAAKIMGPKKSGRIINISSMAGQVGNIGQTNYAASKAGVIGMTKTLAKELAKDNINVNAIAPGFIMTEMTEKLPEKVVAYAMKMIPLARGGSVDEVANVVYFLSSDLSSYVTGQIIGVNGGLVI